MENFTKKDKELMLAALNFMLKNEPNALQASTLIVPLAIKVESIKVEEQPEE